jgi:hypothetical protein
VRLTGTATFNLSARSFVTSTKAFKLNR